MRTLRLSLAGTVILALLGGLSGAVLAQTTDEEVLDPWRPSHFTGSWTDDYQDEVAGWEWMHRGTYSESLDNEAVHAFVASDTRISGTWTHVLGIRSFPIDVETGMFAPVWSGVVRIENEDGAWSGTFDGYSGGSGGRETYRLDGEGAYEGLTAVFGWIEEGDTYEGVIIPAVPPDYPEPILAAAGADDEAAAEEAAAEAEEEADVAAGQTAGDTFVTGTMDCGQVGERTVLEDDAVELHLFPGRCAAEMSDPRVSGIVNSDIEQVCFKEAGDHVCMLWGAAEITGPDGTWVGTIGSVHDDTLAGLPAWGVTEGTGAYEGWTYWFYTPDQIDPTATASGILYEGPPPPWAKTLPLVPME